MDDLHPTSPEPEVCHVCGRRAIGIALPGGRRDDHAWLCAECYPLLEYVKSVRRWDAYELKAIDAVDGATSDFAAEHGTDIAAMDETTRRALWRCVLRSWQDGIRAGLREGPF
jgi:hypothetical protein